MPTRVGPKGQVVIEKEIREQLGIEPGALAIQRVVDGHLEIWFAPAPHKRSLRGALQHAIQRSVPPEEWNVAREKAWEEAAWEKETAWRRSDSSTPTS